WPIMEMYGHPMELGVDFQSMEFHRVTDRLNATLNGQPIPYLAALICLSAFDIALHDAFGNLHDVDVYNAYSSSYISRDLAEFFGDSEGNNYDFHGEYPDKYLVMPPKSLPVWHLVGGLDPL